MFAGVPLGSMRTFSPADVLGLFVNALPDALLRKAASSSYWLPIEAVGSAPEVLEKLPRIDSCRWHRMCPGAAHMGQLACLLRKKRSQPRHDCKAWLFSLHAVHSPRESGAIRLLAEVGKDWTDQKVPKRKLAELLSQPDNAPGFQRPWKLACHGEV